MLATLKHIDPPPTDSIHIIAKLLITNSLIEPHSITIIMKITCRLEIDAYDRIVQPGSGRERIEGNNGIDNSGTEGIRPTPIGLPIWIMHRRRRSAIAAPGRLRGPEQ